MTTPHAFDAIGAHRHFAAGCFNRAWELLDLVALDERQVEDMLHAAHASMWHWLQLPERTPTHDAIGTWQLARVYAVAARPAEARRWARRCLEICQANEVDPFYLAYAHEAAARAEKVAGNDAESARHVEAARALLSRVGGEAEDRERLARDLDGIVSTRRVEE